MVYFCRKGLNLVSLLNVPTFLKQFCMMEVHQLNRISIVSLVSQALPLLLLCSKSQLLAQHFTSLRTFIH